MPATPVPDSRDPFSPALEALLARYAEKVRWVARDSRLTPDEVEELLQDVRIRLWRALQRSERNEQVNSSYVHRTVQSAAVDLIRRRRDREDQIDLSRPSGEARLGTSPAPDQVMEDRDLAARVAGAIGALSDSRRPIIHMYLAGYHIEEIAARLGWTEPKTRNLLYRGLAELRQRLQALGITTEGER